VQSYNLRIKNEIFAEKKAKKDFLCKKGVSRRNSANASFALCCFFGFYLCEA
jgi:hypothetical protein